MVEKKEEAATQATPKELDAKLGIFSEIAKNNPILFEEICSKLEECFPNELKELETIADHDEPALPADEKTVEGRFARFLAKGKFNDLDPSITAPNFRYTINGANCVPGGEVCAISGKPGAGKSSFLAVLAAVGLSGHPFGGIARNFATKKILWIDCEKGNYSCKCKMATFRHIAHIPPEQTLEEAGVDFWEMRDEKWSDRIPFIQMLAEMESYDTIIIDGIFDLTDKPNDDTINVTDCLKRLAGSGAAVFAMLHTNKNDDNMRYTLGSELQRLCTTRIEIKDNNGEHWAECNKANDTARFTKVYFKFVEMDGVGIAQPKNSDTAELNEKAKELRKEAEKYFEPEKKYRHKEACNEIEKHGNKKADNAKKKLKELLENDIVKKDDKGMYFLPKIAFPQNGGE